MTSRRWPLHPMPYSGESLSSWLDRLAHAYGYTSEDLLRYDLGFESISSIELDINPPERLLVELSKRTGVSFNQVRSLTVQGWVPLLIDGFDSVPNFFSTYAGGHSLLYPVSLRPLYEIKDWMPWLNMSTIQSVKGCRICMQEKPEPYYRLSWRMAWMMTCCTHRIMLEDVYWTAGIKMNTTVDKTISAPPELLALDNLTAQAVEKGEVSLPRRKVHGGVWIRLLRALVDELSLPAFPLKRYRPNIAKVWKKLGLEVRQGIRINSIPFEMMKFEQQIILMKAAGTAVQLMQDEQLKQKGNDAILFKPLPINQEDMLAVAQEHSSPSKYELTYMKLKNLMEELELQMHSNPNVAADFRNFLLGYNPSSEKIEEIDNFFRRAGYILPEVVT